MSMQVAGVKYGRLNALYSALLTSLTLGMRLSGLMCLPALYARQSTAAEVLHTQAIVKDISATTAAASLGSNGERLSVCYVKRDGRISSTELSVTEEGLSLTTEKDMRCEPDTLTGTVKWLRYSPQGRVLFLLHNDLNMYVADCSNRLYWASTWPSGNCDVIGWGGDACRTQSGLAGEPQIMSLSNKELRYAKDYVVDTRDERHRSHLRMGAVKTYYVNGGVYALCLERDRAENNEAGPRYRWAAENLADILTNATSVCVPPVMSTALLDPERSSLYMLQHHNMLLLVSVMRNRLMLNTFSEQVGKWTQAGLVEALPEYISEQSAVGGFFSLMQGSTMTIGWPSGHELAVLQINGKTLEYTVTKVQDSSDMLTDWEFIWGGIVGEYLVIVRQGTLRGDRDRRLALTGSWLMLKEGVLDGGTTREKPKLLLAR